MTELDAEDHYCRAIDYRFSPGDESNLRLAIYHYKLAARAGHEAAKADLVEISQDPPSYDLSAITDLARLFFVGDGVHVDVDRAMSLFKFASERGHIQATYTLGFVYDDGFCIPRQRDLAVKYYSAAAQSGHQRSRLLSAYAKGETPYSPGAVETHGEQLGLLRECWLDDLHCLLVDSEDSPSEVALQDAIGIYIDALMDLEQLDAWVPLSNISVQKALAYYLLGVVEKLAQAHFVSQGYARFVLAQDLVDRTFFSGKSFDETFEFIIGLPNCFLIDPLNEMMIASLKIERNRYDLAHSEINTRMYIEGDWFATLWLSRNYPISPSTSGLRGFIADINRYAKGSVRDPSGALLATEHIYASNPLEYQDEFFIKHKQFFREVACRYYPFSEPELDYYIGNDLIDGGLISDNKYLNWSSSLILKYKEFLDIGRLSANESVPWDEALVDVLRDRIDWSALSQNSTFDLSEKRVEKYASHYDWGALSKCVDHAVFEYLLEKYPDKIDWTNACYNECLNWSPEFIQRHAGQINWGVLSFNNSVKWKLSDLAQFNDLLDWVGLSGNPHLPWSIDFIDEYYENINWTRFANNPGLFWSDDFVADLGDLLDHDALSCNQFFPWTEDFIEENEDLFNWEGLSSNPGLPWSLLFFEKYQSRFTWINSNFFYRMVYGPGLSGNHALPWSMEFFDQHADQLDDTEVAKVYSAEVERLSPERVRRIFERIAATDGSLSVGVQT